MIEIPESITLSKQLADAFAGKQACFVQANKTAHGFSWYSHDPEEYSALLSGKTLDAVNSWAGQIELIFEDMHLVFNDGTTPHYLSPEDPEPKKHQLLIRFDDGSGFFCTVRMYGGMLIYPNGETDNEYYLVSRDKPSPLSDEFDREYFQSIVDEAEGKLSAKALLATEQRIPGLGNGVLQDILFNARIRPQRKLANIDGAGLDIMFASVKDTLANMTELHGRDVEKDLYGHPGGYPTILSNKTKDSPCPDCGQPIAKKAYMGGNVYFCPNCQPL
jgi:formamidopyrimidine-DNA glycosylase